MKFRPLKGKNASSEGTTAVVLPQKFTNYSVVSSASQQSRLAPYLEMDKALYSIIFQFCNTYCHHQYIYKKYKAKGLKDYKKHGQSGCLKLPEPNNYKENGIRKGFLALQHAAHKRKHLMSYPKLDGDM